jgi:hypothetical protein
MTTPLEKARDTYRVTRETDRGLLEEALAGREYIAALEREMADLKSRLSARRRGW